MKTWEDSVAPGQMDEFKKLTHRIRNNIQQFIPKEDADTITVRTRDGMVQVTYQDKIFFCSVRRMFDHYRRDELMTLIKGCMRRASKSFGFNFRPMVFDRYHVLLNQYDLLMDIVRRAQFIGPATDVLVAADALPVDGTEPTGEQLARAVAALKHFVFSKVNKREEVVANE